MLPEVDQFNEDRLRILTPVEKWSYCELIYEEVKSFKDLSEQELLLELQLEETRDKKRQAQTSALEALAHLSSPAFARSAN